MRPEHWLYTIPLRLRSLFRRAQADQELDDELRDHLERNTEQYVAQGIAQEEAHRRARLDLDGIEQTKEKCRDSRRVNWIQDFVQDLRYGLRLLRKSSGFTAVSIVTLALGIGANTAIFSVINGVLLSPLPYKDPQRLVAMKQNESLLNVLDIQHQTHVFSQGGAVNIEDMDYTSGSEPVQIHGGYINAGFLETLGVPPMLGRVISPAEDVQGGPRLVIVSNSFWQN